MFFELNLLSEVIGDFIRVILELRDMEIEFLLHANEVEVEYG